MYKDVENKLNEAVKDYGELEYKTKSAKTMLVELDGCEIRTGVSQPKEGTNEVSLILNQPKKKGFQHYFKKMMLERVDSYVQKTVKIAPLGFPLAINPKFIKNL